MRDSGWHPNRRCKYTGRLQDAARPSKHGTQRVSNNHMKIWINIPDFVPPERAIHILAGIERIGYIEPHTHKIFVKTHRCSQCGQCCKELRCEFLEKEPGNNDMWRCGKAVMRPFLCCVTEPKTVLGCTVRYEEVV